MRRFWEIEFPVGDPIRGPAFGDRTDPVTLGIVSAIGTGIGAVSTLSGLFGGKDSTPAPAPAPVVSKPTVMPTPDDDAMALARKKSLAGQVARRGRQSTVLESDTSGDLLGG